MQHYGLPRRLLDITSNALVALYFACCSLSGEADCKDGQVLVYQVQKDAIKNYNSDTVSVLSNLVQLDSGFELFIRYEKKELEELEKSYQKFKEEILELAEQLKRQGQLQQLDGLKKELNEVICSEQKKVKNNRKTIEKKELHQTKLERNIEILEYKLLQDTNSEKYNSAEEVTRLIVKKIDILGKMQLENKIDKFNIKKNQKERFLYFIKQEKSYFVDRIDEEKDVRKIVCVRAKLNNPRIIRQSGLFFLFGMGDTKGEPIRFLEYMNGIKEHPSPTIQEMINPRILISGQAKQTIIKELRALGISEETLMPEIDSVAKSIKNRYSH